MIAEASLPGASNALAEPEHHAALLKQLTAVLIDSTMQYNELKDACEKLKTLFLTTSGLAEEDTINREDIFTANGKAIAPVWAASCITDIIRTRSFLRGVKEAIEDKLKVSGERPVQVLYAGAGPFATLLTPLTSVFTPAQLQIFIIEINPESINCLQNLIVKLGLGEYIAAIFEADASQFEIPADCKPDILVTETMMQALRGEPQVAITVNLLGQCSNSTILIPEEIEVTAGLIKYSSELTVEEYPLKKLLQFNKDVARDSQSSGYNLLPFSEAVAVELQHDKTKEYATLALMTKICVYKNHTINYKESGLTIHQQIMDVDSIKEWPCRLLFKYHLGTDPGFQMQFAR